MEKHVLIYHNIPAPYRTPLFEAISAHVKLDVIYYENSHTERKWDDNLLQSSHKYNFCKNTTLSISGKKIALSIPPLRIISNNTITHVIILENPSNIITSLLLAFYHKLKKHNITIWTGNFPSYKSQETHKFLNILLRILQKWTYSLADNFIVYGKNTTSFLNESYNIKKSDCIEGSQGHPQRLLPNNLHYLRSERKKNIDTIIERNELCFVGYLRVSPNKGLDHLLKYLHQNPTRLESYTIHVIGDGPQLSALKIMAQGAKVKFHGHVEGQEKFNIISKCKALILPSEADSWGWVVNEACAVGVPVLCSSLVMAKEIINDFENGIEFNIHDHRSIDNAFLWLEQKNKHEYLDLYNKSVSAYSHYGLNHAVSAFLKAIE